MMIYDIFFDSEDCSTGALDYVPWSVFQVCVSSVCVSLVCLFSAALRAGNDFELGLPPLASETETDSTDSTVHSMGPYLSPRNWTARPHKLCEPSPEARLRLLYSCVAGYLAW